MNDNSDQWADSELDEPSATPDPLRSALLVALAVVSIGGAALAYWSAETAADASREIGGAIVSGGIVGFVLLAYQDRADDGRAKRDDRRENRLRLIDDEREERATTRSLDVIAREDRLHVWRQLDQMVLEHLYPLTAKMREGWSITHYEQALTMPYAFHMNKQMQLAQDFLANDVRPTLAGITDDDSVPYVAAVHASLREVDGMTPWGEAENLMSEIDQAILRLRGEVILRRIRERGDTPSTGPPC